MLASFLLIPHAAAGAENFGALILRAYLTSWRLLIAGAIRIACCPQTSFTRNSQASQLAYHNPIIISRAKSQWLARSGYGVWFCYISYVMHEVSGLRHESLKLIRYVVCCARKASIIMSSRLCQNHWQNTFHRLQHYTRSGSYGQGLC